MSKKPGKKWARRYARKVRRGEITGRGHLASLKKQPKAVGYER